MGEKSIRNGQKANKARPLIKQKIFPFLVKGAALAVFVLCSKQNYYYNDYNDYKITIVYCIGWNLLYLLQLNRFQWQLSFRIGNNFYYFCIIESHQTHNRIIIIIETHLMVFIDSAEFLANGYKLYSPKIMRNKSEILKVVRK